MLTYEYMDPGTEINGYRLIQYITSGDFGHTYRALHDGTASIVVIKLLPKATLLTTTGELFRIDEGLLMQLSHPHLLSILDLKLCRDSTADLHCQPYIVTRYASNGSLRRRIQKRMSKPFSVEETLSIIVPVGQALQYLHDKDIIHRGIQPECILFDEEYRPHLSGLDLAIIDNGHSPWTLGTKHYRALEQFDGIVHKQSDQFALACIAYELLTGQHPFFPDLMLEPSKKRSQPLYLHEISALRLQNTLRWKLHKIFTQGEM